MSILKTTILFQIFVANGMLAANKFSDIKGGDKLIEKYGKLSKTRKLFKSRNSKSEKLFKSQKLAKSEKKLSKSENLHNFNVKKNRSSFLTPKIRAAFNRLQLAFTKTPIF